MNSQPENTEQNLPKQHSSADFASEVGSSAVRAVLPDMNLYHPASTVGREGPTSDPVNANYNRGVADYEQLLSTLESPFSIKDWKHKTILELGSGGYDRFGVEARARGVKVVSLNPALKEEAHRDLLAKGLDKANQTRRERQGIFSFITREAASTSIAGLGQSLPFKDASFDGVVSVFGVPQYLHHQDEEYTPDTQEKDRLLIAKAFEEIVRVLKPGGKAYLRDRHMKPDDTSEWHKRNSFSQSDGTEVLDVLAEHELRGVRSEVDENAFGVVDRLIVIYKPLATSPK